MTARHLPFFGYGTLLPGKRGHRLPPGRTVSRPPAALPGAPLLHGPGPVRNGTATPAPQDHGVQTPTTRVRRRPVLVAVAHGIRDPRALPAVRAPLDRVRARRPGLGRPDRPPRPLPGAGRS